MKKLFLTLIVLVTTSLASFAQINLMDAYSSIASIPGMKAKPNSTIDIDGENIIYGAHTVAINTADIDNMRDQFLNVIESIPMKDVLIKANNQHEFATILAEPADYDLYNILILQGNSVTGDFYATYAQTEREFIKAIDTCELILDSNQVVVVPTKGGVKEYITMSR